MASIRNKNTEKKRLAYTYIAVLIIMFVGLYITRWILTPPTILSGIDGIVLGEMSYVSPSVYTSIPREPEIAANAGRNINRYPITLVISDGTFSYDAYIAIGTVPKGNPIRLCKRFQVTPIYEIWGKSFYNEARLVANEDSIITISYNDGDLRTNSGLYLPEDSLRMVYSPDNGATWSMLKSSIVDTTSNKVSAITSIGGGYMLMSGFGSSNVLCNYRSY